MSATTTLRAHHKELVDLVGTIQKKLTSSTLAEQAKSLRADLSKMASLLMVHLAMEDNVMYPKLIGHADKGVAALAKKFFDEMEGIKGVFGNYKNKWMATGAIEGQPGNFVTETNGLFKALGGRISKEDNDLYPVAEKLGI